MFKQMIQRPHEQHGVERAVTKTTEASGIAVDHAGKLNTLFLCFLLSEREALGRDVNEGDFVALPSKDDGVTTDASADVSHSRRRRREVLTERAHRQTVLNSVPQEPVPLVLRVLVVIAGDPGHVICGHGGRS
jgi:hypothetical protein